MPVKRNGRPLKGDRPATAAERKAAQRVRERGEADSRAAQLAGLAERLREMAGANGEMMAIADAIDSTVAGQAPTAHVTAEQIQVAGADLNDQARMLLDRLADILRRANGEQMARISSRIGYLEAIMPARSPR